jgi:hypothetical protein
MTFDPRNYGATPATDEEAGFNPRDYGARPAEDDYLPLIGKSVAAAGEGILNLPKNLVKLNDLSQNYRISEFDRLAEKYAKTDPQKAKKIRMMNAAWGNDKSQAAEKVPAFGTMAKNKLGIGDPQSGDNELKKYTSFLTEYMTPLGALGGLGKGASALGKTAKTAGLGTAVYAAEKNNISGLIPEGIAIARGKVKPYTSKITQKLTPDIFRSKAKKISIAEEKVAQLLNEYGTKGGNNLNNILNFDEKAKRLVTPTTAELAQNTGISNIHNAIIGNSPSISQKMIKNDSILREHLEKIGKGLNLDEHELSEIVRGVIQKNLTKATKRRKKITDPLYEALEKDNTRVEPKAFKQTLDLTTKSQIGDTRKKLTKLKDVLPDANKDLITRLEKKLAALGEHSLISLSPEYKSISDRINHIKKTATPAQIDKMISLVGEKISKLKENPAANRTLIKKYNEIKLALEADLKNTAKGNLARSEFRKLSADVNKIENNKLLSKFTKKDKYGDYLHEPDKLLSTVLSSPISQVKAYKQQIKGTPAEKATSAFIRKKYLGAADEGLPTYASSRNWLKTYGVKAKELLTPEDYQKIIDNRVYLSNRNKVQTAGKVVNSTTTEKTKMLKNIGEYLGEEYGQGLFSKIAAYGSKKIIPYAGTTISDSIKAATIKRNIAYDILEEAMTDPAVAKRLLQSLKPKDADLIKRILPITILNEINM